MMRTLPPRQRRLAEAERHSARTVNKGHGRRETRTLLSTSQLDETYLDLDQLVVFLDDLTPYDVEKISGIKVVLVDPSARGLIEGINYLSNAPQSPS